VIASGLPSPTVLATLVPRRLRIFTVSMTTRLLS
jgi:hypothetical protein